MHCTDHRQPECTQRCRSVRCTYPLDLLGWKASATHRSASTSLRKLTETSAAHSLSSNVGLPLIDKFLRCRSVRCTYPLDLLGWEASALHRSASTSLRKLTETGAAHSLSSNLGLPLIDKFLRCRSVRCTYPLDPNSPELWSFLCSEMGAPSSRCLPHQASATHRSASTSLRKLTETGAAHSLSSNVGLPLIDKFLRCRSVRCTYPLDPNSPELWSPLRSEMGAPSSRCLPDQASATHRSTSTSLRKLTETGAAHSLSSNVGLPLIDQF